MYYETIIIGGGQAGLSLSYYLNKRDSEHIVLEQASAAANSWRNGRWDSFTLVSPNWAFQIPGIEYRGSSPDGFMPRDEIVKSFDDLVERNNLPVKCNQRVISVAAGDEHRFLVKTEDAEYYCNNVVIASGLFQKPKVPGLSSKISEDITQLTSGEYRSAAALPEGAVLVVGTGQSGCQIVEDLRLAERKVYLSTGGAGRAPRRYRGKDIFFWLASTGFMDRTVDMLPDPSFRFLANPHVSGAHGGATLNLHKFYRQGVTLLGHIADADDKTIQFAPDLKSNLQKSDKFEKDLLAMVDKYIEDNHLELPEETIEIHMDGYSAPDITKLDLDSEGISTIIWACGYSFNFDYINFPVFDGYGYPIQEKCATAVPGLYFLGLPWLIKLRSGLVIGVGEDAKYLSERITTGESIKAFGVYEK